MLAFEYQKLFPYEGYYFHAGLANFASQFEYSYGNSSDVNNIWNYEYKSHSNFTVSHLDEKIDLGVTVIGIFAGLNF